MSVKITVNGEEHELLEEALTYDKAVEIATGAAAPGYSVYFRGSANPNNVEGALRPGERVVPRHLMQVTVAFTDTAGAQS